MHKSLSGHRFRYRRTAVALLAAPNGPVRVVTKKESRESNTNYAQGGIAAAVSPLDDFDLHVQDTLQAGDGLCDEDVVRAHGGGGAAASSNGCCPTGSISAARATARTRDSPWAGKAGIPAAGCCTART